jgi:hypothetical protein
MAIPFIFYTSGPIALIITTAGVLLFMYHLDFSGSEVMRRDNAPEKAEV